MVFSNKELTELPVGMKNKKMQRSTPWGPKHLLVVLLVLIGVVYLYNELRLEPQKEQPKSTVSPDHQSTPSAPKPNPPDTTTPKTKHYSYKVVQTFPHDPKSFTQGLEIVDGVLYEGTGLNGASKLLRLNMKTGKAEQFSDLHRTYFGEGITIFGDKIYQLTWRSKVGFTYDRNTFEKLETWGYDHEGWGLTHDDKYIIVSDGSDKIRFWDPKSLSNGSKKPAVQKTLKVRYEDGSPAVRLNELELINDEIWANVWMEDRILIINKDTGFVTGIIDLQGIRNTNSASTPADDVLNGIAFDKDTGNIYVTGKKWNTLYQITLVNKD